MSDEYPSLLSRFTIAPSHRRDEGKEDNFCKAISLLEARHRTVRMDRVGRHWFTDSTPETNPAAQILQLPRDNVRSRSRDEKFIADSATNVAESLWCITGTAMVVISDDKLYRTTNLMDTRNYILRRRNILVLFCYILNFFFFSRLLLCLLVIEQIFTE